jgi:RimJ/RimL family protein N-acetyltransferase
MTGCLTHPPADQVEIRLLTPADAPLVHLAFSRLSPESRWRRYGIPLVEPGHVLDWVTQLGTGQHVALGALGPDGEPVAVARYATDGPETAELAVTVIDPWQGRGIGRCLMECLLDQAQQAGLRQVHAFVKPGNRAAIAIMRAIGAWPQDSSADGWLEYAASLAGPR